MSLTKSLKRTGAKLLFKVRKRTPEICLVGGIIGFGGTVILACKATMKAEDVLDKFEQDKAKIEEAKAAAEENPELGYEEKDVKRDQAIATKDMIIGMAKLYAPAVGIGLLSIGLFLTSYRILNGRFVTLMGAYTMLDNKFKRYQDRTREIAGEETEEKIRTGIGQVKAHVLEGDENEDTNLVERDVPTLEDAALKADETDFVVIFSNQSSTQYKFGDPFYNEAFLKAQQAFFNQLLHSRGFVFLSEVKMALGMKVKPIDVITGWIEDSAVGDNYVDFGICGPLYSESDDAALSTGRIVKVHKPTDFMLNFNVDGVIWNLI